MLGIKKDIFQFLKNRSGNTSEFHYKCMFCFILYLLHWKRYGESRTNQLNPGSYFCHRPSSLTFICTKDIIMNIPVLSEAEIRKAKALWRHI